MARRPKYTINYISEVFVHLDSIENKHLGLIAASFVQQLSYTPDVETRNHKPLAAPASFGATWELRFRPINSCRAYYEIDRTENVVTVLAIGTKNGNRLMIGGEEYDL